MSAYDWLFRNRETNKITIGQSPNALQKVFQVALVVGILLPKKSRAQAALGEVAVLSLGLWAVDEVVRGVNPFRRISGAITLGTLAFLGLRK